MTDLRSSPWYEFGKKKTRPNNAVTLEKKYQICISYVLKHYNVYCLVDNCCVLYRTQYLLLTYHEIGCLSVILLFVFHLI